MRDRKLSGVNRMLKRILEDITYVPADEELTTLF